MIVERFPVAAVPNFRAQRTDLIVTALSRRSTRGILICGALRFHCALGRGGLQARKREGDGATPMGAWPIRAIRYRADRGLRPRAPLQAEPIRPADGWCDASSDRNYNRAVRHPYPASAESMWRDDALYDIVVVLGYNDLPRQRGLGSAIFMHIARDGLTPTEGCVALRPRDLRLVLRHIGRNSRVQIKR